MFCWNCGRKNDEGNKFCGECGKTLLAPEGVEAGKGSSSPGSTVTEAGVRSAEKSDLPRSSTKLTNPLVEEPRVVHDVLSPVEEPRVASKASSTPASTETTTRVRAIVSPPAASKVERTPAIPQNRAAVQSVQREDLFAQPRVTPLRTPSGNSSTTALHQNRITGPSFLGLSDEPKFADDGGSYLLDEDENSGSSWRGYLALAFLLIIGILVLRQWTEMRGIASGFAQRMGIGDAPKKVNAKPTVSSSNDQANAATTPDNNVNSGAAPGSDTNASQEIAKAKSPDALTGGKPENDASAKGESSTEKSSTKADSKTDSKSAEENTSEDSGSTPTKSSAAKGAAPAVVANDSQVDAAQKYLQGKGVAQDCNRGVSLLRSAARQANPKARIQMAALYLSGHCVEQDLPQAYSWFAQAKELEPNNNWIERNLNSLWSKMTDEERRRVLR